LHGLLDSHPDEIFKLAIPDPAALDDMDTPADYERQQKRIAAR